MDIQEDCSSPSARFGAHVKINTLGDSSLPLWQILAEQAELVPTSQPQAYLLTDPCVALVRIPMLSNRALNLVASIRDSGVNMMKNLKNRKIGYSIAEALIPRSIRRWCWHAVLTRLGYAAIQAQSIGR